MKLRLFFIISTALHALAFTSPVAFLKPRVQPFIPVTILSRASGGDDVLKASPSKENETGSIQRRSAIKRTVIDKKGEPTNPVEQTSHIAPIEAGPAVEETGIIALSVNSNPSAESAIPSGLGNQYDGMGGANSSRNSANGGESAHRQGTGGAGAPLIQASYGYSPRPKYPDSARSTGKEGRVLLRVLVDAYGKTKTVEVNLSSGTDALDRAAVDAVQRWRFSPARHGDQPVESWVRIPIDFRLTDAKR